MKKRRYVNGITFFTTPEMNRVLREMSDKNEVSIGAQIRELLHAAITNQRNTGKEKYNER